MSVGAITFEQGDIINFIFDLVVDTGHVEVKFEYHWVKVIEESNYFATWASITFTLTYLSCQEGQGDKLDQG